MTNHPQESPDKLPRRESESVRQIWEVKIDSHLMDAEADEKGVTFHNKGNDLPFLSILWQDIYSAAWRFAYIRSEYEKKTEQSL